MLKIIFTASLILAVLLFPPAALAFISQNAIPGDRTYGIKRKLEDGIILVAGLTPTTKAWFSVAVSQRRFKEATALLKKGENAKTSLNESVVQSNMAVDEINQINDKSRKKNLAVQMLRQMQDYDLSLANEEQSLISNSSQQSTQPQSKSSNSQNLSQSSLNTQSSNSSAINTVTETRVEIIKTTEVVKEIIVQSGGNPNQGSVSNGQTNNYSSPTPSATSTPIPSPTPTPSPMPTTPASNGNAANNGQTIFNSGLSLSTSASNIATSESSQSGSPSPSPSLTHSPISSPSSVLGTSYQPDLGFLNIFKKIFSLFNKSLVQN